MLIILEDQEQPQWATEKEQWPAYYSFCILDCALTITVAAQKMHIVCSLIVTMKMIIIDDGIFPEFSLVLRCEFKVS